VRRERGRQEPGHELAHLVGLEPLAGLDGGAAGVRRGEALQPVGERAEPPASEIGDQLAEAARASKRGCGFGAVCTTTARPENGSTS